MQTYNRVINEFVVKYAFLTILSSFFAGERPSDSRRRKHEAKRHFGAVRGHIVILVDMREFFEITRTGTAAEVQNAKRLIVRAINEAIHLLKHNNIVDIEGDTSTWIKVDESRRAVAPRELIFDIFVASRDIVNARSMITKWKETRWAIEKSWKGNVDRVQSVDQVRLVRGRYLKMGNRTAFNGSSTQAGKDVTENNDNKGEEIVGDPENDMLGSVKTLDWNDEATEEQGVMESPVEVIDDDTA
nr:hypothetical protein [Tanacetum cinerariifolium]